MATMQFLQSAFDMSNWVSTDEKLDILYDNYKENLHISAAGEEISAFRNQTRAFSLATTLSVFYLNERRRMVKGNRYFNLIGVFPIITLVVPGLFFGLLRNKYEDRRLKDSWRVHRNRMDKGLGGTYSGSGWHDGKDPDFYKNLTMVTYDIHELVTGEKKNEYFGNPFIRWHKQYKNYSGNLGYIEDYSMQSWDQFERFKKFNPKKEHVEGWTPNNPLGDDEEEYRLFDVQGEGPFTNPPDPNRPLIDHAQDEEFIWNFPKNSMNQFQVKNLQNTEEGYMNAWAPQWGQKLSQPHFYKREKMEKFFRHWNHRIGLEDLKKKINQEYGEDQSAQQKKEINARVSNYIEDCYNYEADRKFDDVFVTDHIPVDKKQITGSQEEDIDFFEYQQAVEAYNNDTSDLKQHIPARSAYPLGSIQQRILEPLAGAIRDKEGTLNLTVSDRDLNSFNLDNEDTLKAQFEDINNGDGEFDDDQNDAERLQRLARVYSGSYDTSEWNQIISDSLSTFKNGEKYDFVRDLKDSYGDSLKMTTEEQIFKTIPDYIFWDIKKPLTKKQARRMNKYNQIRGREGSDIFDMRSQEEYMRRQNNRDNLNDSITLYRQY